jgi:tetratricopeptide (TPR) repeat protein
VTAFHNRSLLSLALALVLTGHVATAQEQKPEQGTPPGSPEKTSTQKRAVAHDSIVVGAHLTPEEVEDGKINDAYQPLYHLKKPNDCPQIEKLCQSEIIPMAERSKFELTRNKFLYLANRDVAICESQTGRPKEAEERYQKMFDYIRVWPGTDDSDYPLNYRLIGEVRIMQMRWKDAEESLEKSITIFGEQIDRALHSDSEFSRNGHSKNLKMSDAWARNLLALAYFRDGREAEAMQTLETAYQEAIESSASAEMIQEIIEAGRVVSDSLGDAAAMEKWKARTPPPK